MKRMLFALAFLSAAPALAAPAPSVVGKHDANAPINIAADKFVADSNARTGTWTGNVIVIQSDMRMRANTVRLNVVGKENKPDKIFANGNVVVDSPNSGTVTGDNGVYDVVAHTVTMTGKVVLTKEKDVMRGSQLTVNLDTGVATLGSGAKPSTTTQGGGRVQGIFTPPPSSNPPQTSN
ncbi:MAG TPA: LptA/OstA family protein [Rhizomicrobium sp.]|jgi:lipopolysaccharide export system protein LptA|nr:LptA/OstA family protein [Rhizomicrobium sp.]